MHSDVESDKGFREARRGDEMGKKTTIGEGETTDGDDTRGGGEMIDDDGDSTRDADKMREVNKAEGVDETKGSRYSTSRGVVLGIDGLEIGSDASQS
jgi:hypothetical protein